MSGGHFCDNGYPYYRVWQFADELENEIANNEIPDDDSDYCPRFSAETLAVLRSEISALRRMAEVMRAIDYLYAGDHGEDSFLRALEKAKNPAGGE